MGLEPLLLPSEASCSWGISGPPVAFRGLWRFLWPPGASCGFLRHPGAFWGILEPLGTSCGLLNLSVAS
eukprot:9406522-Pyramimonas_sp.AAC.1